MMNRTPSVMVVRRLAACAVLALATPACSVIMAANQPDKKDLSVLDQGTPRTAVIAELGRPRSTEEDPEGQYCHETYAFEQGYSGWVKGGRVAFHLVADVFTLLLWEIVATPTEAYFDGTEVSLEVLYDKNDRVQSVCVFSGGEAVTRGALVSPDTLRRDLDEAREASRSQAEVETREEPTRKERLAELKRLHESGMITDEEYQKKQREILEELGGADSKQ